MTVLANDLHDHEPSRRECPRDPGPVRAGAFDADSIDVAVGLKEVVQLGVADFCGVELVVSDAAP
ncbi:hypothetical protein GCM10027599_07330 [Yimella radicis]